MSELEDSLSAKIEYDRVRALHRTSGLWDNTLADRYAAQRDLVAFIDETHRSTERGDAGYYGLSAVVFHSDDLPEIRRDLEEIAGGSFWHSKEAVKDGRLRPRIGEMNEYIAAKAAMPAVFFDVRANEISDAQERPMRDLCLDRALRDLDSEGIRDVVLDNFPRTERHNVRLDKAVLEALHATGDVDSRMWMHHARMSEEHALWAADTVAWSIQRHYFGQKQRDSLHIAPLSGRLREVHAATGRRREFTTPQRVELAGPAGRHERTAPIYSLSALVERARKAGPKPSARSIETPPTIEPPGMRKAPPALGPEGPSLSR